MEHSFLDKYSSIDSPIHRLDPRVKLISFFSFILFVIATGSGKFTAFFLYGILMLALIRLSKLPLIFVLKKSLVIIPFVLFIAVSIPFYNSSLTFWAILIKSFLSILSMIILSNTTKFTNFLKALELLKFPRLMTMVLSFMYRYVYISIDELMRMDRARRARSPNSGITSRFRVLANIIGSLFVRSYERGERVYLAMCSRGFDGEVKTVNGFKLSVKDCYFAAALLIALFSIRIWA